MSNRKRDCWHATFEKALTVLEHGLANVDQLRHVNAWRMIQRPMLGKLALNIGKLTMSQVFTILGEQGLRGTLFGETAVDLGFLSSGDVFELLRIQDEFTPCLVDALEKKSVITPEEAAFVLQTTNDWSSHFASECALLEERIDCFCNNSANLK